MFNDFSMTIAPRRHQHPVRHLRAIVQDGVPRQRRHVTIGFVHDQIGRGKVPIAALATRKGGIEPAVGDPYRLATLMPHLANTSALVWLMGSAAGDDVEALHRTRLQTVLERLVDPSDGRGSLVSLTDHGGAALRSAAARQLAYLGRQLDALDAADREKLLDVVPILEKLLAVKA